MIKTVTVKHVITIDPAALGGPAFQPMCTFQCGWQGEWHTQRTDAQLEGRFHVYDVNGVDPVSTQKVMVSA